MQLLFGKENNLFCGEGGGYLYCKQSSEKPLNVTIILLWLTAGSVEVLPHVVLVRGLLGNALDECVRDVDEIQPCD